MTFWDNPLLAIFGVALAVISIGYVLVLIYRERGLFLALFGALAGIVAAVFALGAVGGGAVWLWQMQHEKTLMTKCLTTHEQTARAAAAPDDYFGKQLRKAAADDAKECADFAPRKEAEAKSEQNSAARK